MFVIIITMNKIAIWINRLVWFQPSDKMDKKYIFCILLLVAFSREEIRAKVRFFPSKETPSKKYSFQKIYEVIPKGTICKILDKEIVYNFTCAYKYVNRTISLRSQEITFRPGIVLHNYHVSKDEQENFQMYLLFCSSWKFNYFVNLGKHIDHF